MPASERRPASAALVRWSLGGATAALVAVTTSAVAGLVLAGTATVSPDVRPGTPASVSGDGREREAGVVVVPPVTAWDGGASRGPGSPPALAFRDDSADEVRSRKATVPGALPGSSPAAPPSALPTPVPSAAPAPAGDAEAETETEAETEAEAGGQPPRRRPSPDRARPEPTRRPTTPPSASPQPDREDGREDERGRDRDEREDDDDDQDRGRDGREDRDEGDPAVRSSATPSQRAVPPGHLIGRGHAHHSEDGRGRGHHG